MPSLNTKIILALTDEEYSVLQSVFANSICAVINRDDDTLLEDLSDSMTDRDNVPTEASKSLAKKFDLDLSDYESA